MSFKSIIEKFIALVTGNNGESEQPQDENQEQNFEQNSEESFNLEFDEPAVEQESWSTQDSETPVEHADDQVHNPEFFHEEELH